MVIEMSALKLLTSQRAGLGEVGGVLFRPPGKPKPNLELKVEVLYCCLAELRPPDIKHNRITIA